MKEYLCSYLKELEKVKTKNLSPDEKEALGKNLLTKISFFQHERLIHLLVTIFTGTIACLFLLGFLALENFFLLLLFVLMMCLFIPYIFHYYFLENNVQKLYKIYDEIKDFEVTKNSNKVQKL